MKYSLREKCPNTELFLVCIFLYSDGIPYLSVFSPNTGKYGPEITLYLDTFHAVYNLPPDSALHSAPYSAQYLKI